MDYRSEDYRGQRISARITGDGFTETRINGKPVGKVAGRKVSSELKTLRGYIDSAAERPEAFRNHVRPGSVTIS